MTADPVQPTRAACGAACLGQSIQYRRTGCPSAARPTDSSRPPQGFDDGGGAEVAVVAGDQDPADPDGSGDDQALPEYRSRAARNDGSSAGPVGTLLLPTRAR